MLSIKTCDCGKEFEGKRGEDICQECIENIHISNMLKINSMARAEYVRRNIKFFENLFENAKQKLVFKTLLETA